MCGKSTFRATVTFVFLLSVDDSDTVVLFAFHVHYRSSGETDRKKNLQRKIICKRGTPLTTVGVICQNMITDYM